MQIKCKADNYTYIKREGRIVVFNEIYSNKTSMIFLCAILSILLPDIKYYFIPLAIDIDVTEDSNIQIDKNLNVLGTSHYKYFIPKEHYYKWKKTFRLIFGLIIILELLLNLLILYIFLFSARFNFGAGLAFFCCIFFTFYMGYKYVSRNYFIKKYEIKELMKDYNFE